MPAPPSIPPPYQLIPARHGVMLVNPNDIFMGQSFLRYGECCEHEIQTLLQFLSHPQRLPGMVVEVGSNMGVHTVPLGRELARQGRSMLAFEPQPVIFQQLCANLALNGLMNVNALPYACSSQAGILFFDIPDYLNSGNFGGTALREKLAQGSHLVTAATHAVPCYPLDDLVREEPVALIKIDVEGHELRALQGAEQLLARCHPILYVENDRIDQSPQLIEWLLMQGYRLWWHITRAFNPANFLRNEQNIYGDVCLINMLCLHPSHKIALEGLPEISGPDDHPLVQASTGEHPIETFNPAAADAAQTLEPACTPYAAPR